MDPLFINYINNEGHHWKVCLGVPYATSLWQVGDSAQNNGTFKTEWYGLKDELLIWKYERGLNQVIQHHDVIPTLNRVFPIAFGRVDVDWRAIADQGWYPLNCKLVKHPGLHPEEPAGDAYSINIPVLPDINIENVEGMSASVLDKIVWERLKNNAAAEAAHIHQIIKDVKRVLAGVLAKNGIFALDNEEFLAGLKDRQDKEMAAKTKKACKKRKVILSNAMRVMAAQKRHGHESAHKFESFTFEECSAYLQYKRQDKDPAMAKSVAERRKRCLEVMLRDSPAVSPHNSNDKGESNEGSCAASVKERSEAEQAVVQALTGMGGGQPKDDNSTMVDEEVESEGKEDAA